jgi:outer membrane protein insertion porin family
LNFLIPSIRSVTRFLAQLVLVVAASVCVNAQAADSFVIKDIRIEGLQRVEPGTVFSYLPVQVGDTFTDEKSAEAIKALYSTGFFRDVQIQAQGNILIVIVEERPTISRIEFTGMKEFDQ